MALKHPLSGTCFSSSCWNLCAQAVSLGVFKNVLKGVGGLLFAFGVKIYSANLSLDLVETDVVEAFERGAGDCSDTVVGNQEVLFPPHKDVVSLRKVGDGNWALASHLLIRPKGAKLGPVAEVDFGIGAPVIMLGEEVVLGTNDFSLKVGGECWVVFGQSYKQGVEPVSYDAMWKIIADSARDETNLGYASSRRGKIRAGQHV